jgi:hypothetical protein
MRLFARNLVRLVFLLDLLQKLSESQGVKNLVLVVRLVENCLLDKLLFVLAFSVDGRGCRLLGTTTPC